MMRRSRRLRPFGFSTRPVVKRPGQLGFPDDGQRSPAAVARVESKEIRRVLFQRFSGRADEGSYCQSPTFCRVASKKNSPSRPASSLRKNLSSFRKTSGGLQFQNRTCIAEECPTVSRCLTWRLDHIEWYDHSPSR